VVGVSEDRWTIVEHAHDPRLGLYHHLTDADARRSLESAHGIFVAEGTAVIRRLLGSRYRVRSLLLLPSRAEELAPDLAGCAAPVFVAERSVLAQVAGFDVHRGALAIADRGPLAEPTTLLAGSRTIAILEGLNDHENLGAVARSASALGVDAMLLDPTCADPLYRRAVRVSMGEVLFLPWTRLTPWPSGLAQVRAAGFTLVALTPALDAEPLEAVLDVVRGPIALILGAEGPGLSPAARQAADHHGRIPIAAGVDSLNVGHAAAIAFHSVARRRR
jgi:tRNA G18 (ribose-2'-O)-methylase SpoU